MKVSVLNKNGQDTGKQVTLNDSIFAIEPNDHAIYLDVKQYLADQRQGTAKAKERSEMSGSTRKLGRQKGGGAGNGYDGIRRYYQRKCEKALLASAMRCVSSRFFTAAPRPL